MGASFPIHLKKLRFLFVSFGILRRRVFDSGGSFDITLAVLLLEPLYSPGRIDKFLLARIKRMAHRADFRVDFLGRTSRLESITATAMDRYFIILWMYIFFHSDYAPKYLNLTS